MNHMQRREQLRGIALTIIGGIFWGLAGVCGQYLFEERGLTAKWLVSVRLVLAGLILLLTVWAKQKKQMFEIWREKKRCISAYNVWNIWDGILSIELLCGGGDIKCRNRNSSAVYGADHYYAVRFCSQ